MGDSSTSLHSVESRNGLYRLFQQGIFTDAVILCSDKSFSVHKVILASNCGYFRYRASFTTAPDEKNLIDLSTISGDVMELILDYIYSKTLHLTDENVCQLFIAADYLLMDNITKKCIKFMIPKIEDQICVSMLNFSRLYSVNNLESAILKHMTRNFPTFSNSDEFLKMKLTDVIELLSSDYLNVRSEENTWEAAMRWLEHNDKEAEQGVLPLLLSVRLGLLSTEYFLENVRDYWLVAASEECRPIVIGALRILFDLDITSEDWMSDQVRPRYPREVVFAVGGWSGGSPTNCIETYDIQCDRWSMMNSKNKFGSRAYHGTVVVNKEIYVIGGYNGFDYYNSCCCFNVEKRVWREIAPMNKSRCYVSVAVLGNFIYAMGGYNGQRRQSTVERYDIRRNQWTMIKEMHSARSDASATAFDGKLYIVGGFNGHECLSSAETYDPTQDEWRMLPPMHNRRSGVSCIIFQQKLLVYGGFNGLSRLASGESFDFERSQWRFEVEMLHARSNFALAIVDDALLAIGGFNGVTTTADVECFQIETAEWTAVSSLKVQRSALAAVVVGNISNIEQYAFRSPQKCPFNEHEQVMADIEQLDIPPDENPGIVQLIRRNRRPYHTI